MNFENELIVLGIVVGPIFLLAGAVLYFFPPKKINSLYGYRTANSMKNQQRWNFSQKYAGKCMAILGFIFGLVIFLLSFLSFSETTNVAVGIGLLILMAVILIWIVERKLKQKFG